MKTKVILAGFIFIFLSMDSFSQFTFGVSPGIGLNSAYFGYRINNFVPYAGFQYLNARIKSEESGERYDGYSNQTVSYSNTNEFSGSLYVPYIGLKYFMIQHNSIKAYLSLCVSKPFVRGTSSTNDHEDDDFKEDLKNINIWGGEFGFGMEYFLSDHFSLGGEFGLRYFHLKYKETEEYQQYNPNTNQSQVTRTDYDYRLNISPTFSRISLNYYF